MEDSTTISAWPGLQVPYHLGVFSSSGLVNFIVVNRISLESLSVIGLPAMLADGLPT
jgi:hypothetical protein